MASDKSSPVQGRYLRAGDQLPLGRVEQQRRPGVALPQAWQPGYPAQAEAWSIEVLPGPNAAPDYFTQDDIDTLHSATYEVHYNSCAPPSRACQRASSVGAGRCRLAAQRDLRGALHHVCRP